jgi:thioredoxin 1
MIQILTPRSAKQVAVVMGLAIPGLLGLSLAGCGSNRARSHASEPVTRNQALPPDGAHAEDFEAETVVYDSVSDAERAEFGETPKFRLTTATRTAPGLGHADDSNFEQVVLQSEVPVLVDFYADWCGPCRKLTPVLEEIAAETPHARIVKVNVDHAPEVSGRYGIRSIPALIVFQNGQPVANHVGFASKDQLQQLLQP